MNNIGLCRAKTLDFKWEIGYVVFFNNKYYLIPENETPIVDIPEKLIMKENEYLRMIFLLYQMKMNVVWNIVIE